ncbi:MAG: class I SAM-dependent methyltransferase [Candidatus Micrarchaeota archaeon]|nr:class I SAM-dependent methyltransferase [Candidatus Micrarchaeota archaeon]
MSKMKFCKVCNAETVKEFMSFGKMPMGNMFLKKDHFGEEKTHELKIGFCEQCKLVQQIDLPPPELLEADYGNYAYVPFGKSLRENLANLGLSLYTDFKMNKDSFVLDLGSNDGTLLEPLKDKCKILGIEPARNISEIARKRGVPTITSFFTSQIAKEILQKQGRPDAVTVTQVLQHIPDLNQFIGDIGSIIKESGVLVIEGRYFRDTLRKSSYDTVYNETLYLFTLSSIKNLLERHQFHLFRAELNDVYGGSLRIYARKNAQGKEASVEKILEDEKKGGIGEFETYEKFAKSAYKLKDELNELIKGLKEKKIVAYGASSTSATLLNFCEITKEQVSYIIDDSPLKQGLYAPLTHIPIVSSDILDKEKPDYILLLIWRLKEEILPKIEKYNVPIIIPLPEVKIVS